MYRAELLGEFLACQARFFLPNLNFLNFFSVFPGSGPSFTGGLPGGCAHPTPLFPSLLARSLTQQTLGIAFKVRIVGTT